MPSAEKKKKHLVKFGKNRREAKNADDKDWMGNRMHQDEMRTVVNKQFDRYYSELQKLGQVEAARLAAVAGQQGGNRAIPTPQELWDAEMALFRRPLDTTVWVNDTDPLSQTVREFFERQDASVVQPIPWYPIEGMGWRILADKTSFRKRPDMQALRQFLIRQTALGTVSRQEEVSMIPPFLLDIQPNDVCLDMCASPGSKTAQLLCALGRHKVVPPDSTVSPFPFDYDSDGLVVANELDTKRANMLVHQVKRLRLLFPFALFTNHDARYFPDIPLDPSLPLAQSLPVVSDGCTEDPPPLRFDKILCDVVCSGDGTLRKAPHVFKIWSPREGMSLQRTQVHIALRACHLLKVGGRLVYSTCSLNPIENEAVVAQLIHRTRGAMKLVDVQPQLLPNLVCARGMRSWTVTDHHGHVVERPGQLHEAFFPPNTPGGYSSPAVDATDLSLCLRLLPSHCSGGGFFVAVLDKVSEFRMSRRDVEAVEEEEEEEGVKGGNEKANARDTAPHTGERGEEEGPAVGKRQRNSGNTSRPPGKTTAAEEEAPASTAGGGSESEPPVKKPKTLPPQFVAPPAAELHAVVHGFYGIATGAFPTDNVVMRTATVTATTCGGTREPRMTPSSVCTFVARSARRVLAQKRDNLLVVSAGLRIFAFETLDKGWRIASEAASLFAKLMANSPRLLPVPVGFVQRLIQFGGKLKEMSVESIEDDELRSRVEALPLGTVLLKIAAPVAVGGVFYSVALRARSRVQLLVDHEDLVGMQLRLGLEPLNAGEMAAEQPSESAC